MASTETPQRLTLALEGRSARKASPAQAQRPPDERSHLVHELHVHQIELEMQNDELRGARHEVEESLQRYAELFDFAPVDYVVLDQTGAILEGNLEFARMVGVPRGELRGWSFTSFVDREQRAALRAFVQRSSRMAPARQAPASKSPSSARAPKRSRCASSPPSTPARSRACSSQSTTSPRRSGPRSRAPLRPSPLQTHGPTVQSMLPVAPE